MAIGKMSQATIMLAKIIQRFSSTKRLKWNGEQLTLLNSKRAFSVTETDRNFCFAGKPHKVNVLLKLAISCGRLWGNVIPPGCLAVYVGTERRRFVINTNFLSHSLFKELLEKSKDEFGFQYQGGLHIACEPKFFEHLLWMIITEDESMANISLEELGHEMDVFRYALASESLGST